MASDFVSVTQELLLIGVAAVQHCSKKTTKFGNKLFKDMYIVYFLAINTPKICSKCPVSGTAELGGLRGL